MARAREDDTRVSSSGAANVSGKDTGGRQKEGRARLCDVGTSEGGVEAIVMRDCDDAVPIRGAGDEVSHDRGGHVTAGVADLVRTSICLVWLLAAGRLVRVRGVVGRERKPRSFMYSNGGIDRECVETLCKVRNV